MTATSVSTFMQNKKKKSLNYFARYEAETKTAFPELQREK